MRGVTQWTAGGLGLGLVAGGAAGVVGVVSTVIGGAVVVASVVGWAVVVPSVLAGVVGVASRADVVDVVVVADGVLRQARRQRPAGGPGEHAGGEQHEKKASEGHGWTMGTAAGAGL